MRERRAVELHEVLPAHFSRSLWMAAQPSGLPATCSGDPVAQLTHEDIVSAGKSGRKTFKVRVKKRVQACCAPKQARTI